jgi:hypothetical protein
MYADDGFAVLKFFENRLQDRVSDVHAVGIRKENKAIEPEDVECVGELLQREASTSGKGRQAKPANRSGRERTSSAENSLQRRAKARAFALSPVCTPGVLSETTAKSMPASSMNEMLASLDH